MSKLLLPEGTKGASELSASTHITKEVIETRLKKLETEKANIMNAIAAYEGAIQDCQHWLKELSGDGQSNPS